MGKLNFISIALLSMCMGFISCENEMEILSERIPIHISFTPQTRATDDAFEEGDKIGLYVSNYNNGVPSTLMTTGNHVDNAMFVYEDSKWLPENNIYWKDKNTAADFYAYYPYSASVNISAHPFFVQADQSTEDAFWASDFLWGKATNVTPTPSSVAIQTNHSLSSILVDIKPGSGFTAASWAAAEKSVKICEIKTAATINLSTGVATATGNGGEIIPLYAAETGTTISYKAMMIPQVVADNSRLVVVTVDGTEYVYRKGYTFTPNTQHKFTVTVNKSESSVDVTIGEWEIDRTTNEGNAEEENESEANIIPNNQIWYTATEKVEPSASTDFGATIQSNEWDSATGKGVITFDGDVTTIGNDIFSSGKSCVVSLTLPGSVTMIKEWAFRHCSNLASIYIPNGVSIEPGAFYDLPCLAEFQGEYASADGRCLIIDGILHSFAPAGLSEYIIPDGVVSIGNQAFYNCNRLTTVTIPDGVTSIGHQVFGYCGYLKNIIIPNTVTSIGPQSFMECSCLENVTIPDGVNTIEVDLFSGCGSLKSVKMPNNTTSIEDGAFANCSNLTEVTIPNSVKTIGRKAFYCCSSIEVITIPVSVTSIGGYAFCGCESLISVYCKPTTPPLPDSEMFDNNASGRKIYVPSSTIDTYKTTYLWDTYADCIFVDSSEN